MRIFTRHFITSGTKINFIGQFKVWSSAWNNYNEEAKLKILIKEIFDAAEETQKTYFLSQYKLCKTMALEAVEYYYQVKPCKKSPDKIEYKFDYSIIKFLKKLLEEVSEILYKN